MRNNSKARLAVEDGDISFQKPENRTWRLGCILLGLVCLALLITVIALAVKDTSVSSTHEYLTTDSQICNTPHCIKIAATLLENMNPNVDPCSNFFDFACGGWVKKNVIPEDRPRYSAFAILREQVQIILKDLFERESQIHDVEALIKVKDFYTSCIDLVTIEKRDAEPLIQLLTKLGGWPVLANLPGGNWDESLFNLEQLLGTLLGGYNSNIIIQAWVSVDDKNSSRYVIKVDQPQELGMQSRKYFLDPQYQRYKMAYYHYMVTIAMMLGANQTTAEKDMTDILEFETTLANLSTPEEKRRNNEKLYNPTTIGQLKKDVPEIDWIKYFKISMPDGYDIKLDSETIINRNPEYVSKVAKLAVHDTPPRILANYFIWRITMYHVTNLSRRFRDAQQEYNRILIGTSTVQARWRSCVDYVNDAMEFATGRLYVPEHFGGDSKKNTERMIANLKKSFKDMLDDNAWMDEETKLVAAQKCDAMQVQVGYPDWIMDDTKLNEKYQELNITSNYFENILGVVKWTTEENWKSLRKKVDKNEWSFGPAVVNAYYSSSKNQIAFPAGILQPPFYHADSPRYLNYGGIGMVIGHEITHGFDDKGRQYDKEGNLKQWWTNQSITNFVTRTQCIVDQYGKYVMPENNKTLNGIQTQGENIADNGGLAQSFKAYNDNDKTSLKLPGLTNYTSEQLFFLNFAQVWCSAFRPEGVDAAILTGVHCPGRYRVIGPAHNSQPFAKAFKCPPSSFMNPSTHDKCTVW